MRYKPVTVKETSESGIAPIIVIILIVIFIGLLLSPQIIKQSRGLIDNVTSKKPIAISTFKIPVQEKSYDQLVADGTIRPAGKILQVSLTYNQGGTPQITITKLVKKNGYAPNVQSVDGDDKAVLLDASNTAVGSVQFAPSTTELHERVTADGKAIDTTKTVETVQNETVLVLSLPTTAKTLQLQTNTGATITTADLTTAQQLDNKPAFKTIIANPKTSQAGSTRVLGEATSSATGQDRYLDIAIIGDKYTDMEKFHNDVTDMWNETLQAEPFKSRSDQILFHDVENYKSLGCFRSPRLESPYYANCDPRAVIDAVTSAGVPYDYIYVSVDEQDFGGIAGALALGDSEFRLIYFPHEGLGHTFNRLLDEGPMLLEKPDRADHFDQQIHRISQDQYTSPNDGNCYAGTPPAKEWESLVKLSDYRKGCYYENWYRPNPYSVMGGSFHEAVFTACCSDMFNKPSQATISRRLDKITGRSGITPGLTLPNQPSATCAAPTRLQASLVEPNVQLNWRASSTPNATYETSVALQSATGEGPSSVGLQSAPGENPYTVLPHTYYLLMTQEQHTAPEPGVWLYKVRAKCGDTYSEPVTTSVTVPTYTLVTVPPPAGRLMDPNPADVGKYVCGFSTDRCSYMDANYYCNNSTVIVQCKYTGRLKICGQFLGCGYIRSVDTQTKHWSACADPKVVETCRAGDYGGQYRFVQPGSNGLPGDELP